MMREKGELMLAAIAAVCFAAGPAAAKTLWIDSASDGFMEAGYLAPGVEYEIEVSGQYIYADCQGQPA